MSKGCEMCNRTGVVFKPGMPGGGDKDTCPECRGTGIVESVTVPLNNQEEAAMSEDKDNCRCPGFTVIGNNCGICPHCQNQAMNKRDAVADLATCDLATPGPWVPFLYTSGWYVRYPNGNDNSIQTKEDAAFIGMAREALPWWIKEAERLRTTLASIEEYGTEEINAGIELRHENARLSAEVNALDRLRTWQLDPAGNLSRRWTHEDDWTGPSLELTEFIAEGEDKFVFVYGDGRGGTRKGIVNVGTEDNHATFAKMVEAALARWAELYGEDKP